MGPSRNKGGAQVETQRALLPHAVQAESVSRFSRANHVERFSGFIRSTSVVRSRRLRALSCGCGVRVTSPSGCSRRSRVAPLVLARRCGRRRWTLVCSTRAGRGTRGTHTSGGCVGIAWRTVPIARRMRWVCAGRPRVVSACGMTGSARHRRPTCRNRAPYRATAATWDSLGAPGE